MSEALAHSFADMLDSMARLFETRAGKAVEAIEAQNSPSRNAYHHGSAASYADAAKECREAAEKMRQP